jgi:histidinol-phosphatase
MTATNYTLDADLALAHELADTARTISLKYFRKQPKQRRKADGSIVTEADEAVEDELRRLLAIARPTDAILGEERGASGAGPRRWVIDAIDGTHDFAEGGAGWAALIALEIDGDLKVGICEQPPVRRRYFATRGGGAFRATEGAKPERLRVTAQSELADARSFVPTPEWLRDDAARAGAAALLAATNPQPMLDHPALQVAFGGYEVAVFFMAGPWDLAAPALVVEEAGGKFTDLDGRHEIAGRGAVFSNGRVHADALRVLRK